MEWAQEADQEQCLGPDPSHPTSGGSSPALDFWDTTLPHPVSPDWHTEGMNPGLEPGGGVGVPAGGGMPNGRVISLECSPDRGLWEAALLLRVSPDRHTGAQGDGVWRGCTRRGWHAEGEGKGHSGFPGACPGYTSREGRARAREQLRSRRDAVLGSRNGTPMRYHFGVVGTQEEFLPRATQGSVAGAGAAPSGVPLGYPLGLLEPREEALPFAARQLTTAERVQAAVPTCMAEACSGGAGASSVAFDVTLRYLVPLTVEPEEGAWLHGTQGPPSASAAEALVAPFGVLLRCQEGFPVPQYTQGLASASAPEAGSPGAVHVAAGCAASAGRDMEGCLPVDPGTTFGDPGYAPANLTAWKQAARSHSSQAPARATR